MFPDTAISDPGYRDALRWLYGLSPNVRTAAQIVADHPRKLPRTRALLAALGNPEAAMATALVAGTKGKGSIAALTEAILRALGYRTGLVTSPHLMSWCERTRINGQDVEPGVVGRLVPLVRAAVERLEAEQPELGQVTTFEAGLGVSLLALGERDVDIAIVEVGVGGSNDATNVLEPLAVGLGPISYDHLATLGSTLTEIATAKSGVFRPGRLVASAPQPGEVLAVVERVARERGAVLELLGREWSWHASDEHPAYGAFTVSGPRGTFEGLTTPLLGRHQRENAAVAVALATGIVEESGVRRQEPGAGEPSPPDEGAGFRVSGFGGVPFPPGEPSPPPPLPHEHGAPRLRRSPRQGERGEPRNLPGIPLSLSGKMTVGSPSPDAGDIAQRRSPACVQAGRGGQGVRASQGTRAVPGELVAAAVRRGLAEVRWPGRLQVLRMHPHLVVDAAHNGDSATRLAEAIRECFGAVACHLVFGMSAGKDLAGILDGLLPIASTVTVTRSRHERSAPLESLADVLAQRGVHASMEPSVERAVEATLRGAEPDALVLVTGSVFIVGEVLETFAPASIEVPP